MINNDFRSYVFSGYDTEAKDAYGQLEEATAIGEVKIAIYITSQSIQDNINYKGANYVGFTYDNSINDTCIIHYGNTNLKVLYVNPQGRLKQVFMAEI